MNITILIMFLFYLPDVIDVPPPPPECSAQVQLPRGGVHRRMEHERAVEEQALTYIYFVSK